MFDDLRTQLRDTPRLRWGIAAIIAIAWLYGILLLREDLQDRPQQERAANQAIARLRAELAQPEWQARVTPAKVMAIQLEARLWQAPTTGLAQAALQDWLTATLLKSGIAKPQVSTTVIDVGMAANPNPNQNAGAGAMPGETATTPADLWKIKAKLSFEFSAPTLMDFLSQLENHDKQTVVELLSVRKLPSPRVEMELYGYFQKPAAPPAKPSNEPAVL